MPLVAVLVVAAEGLARAAVLPLAWLIGLALLLAAGAILRRSVYLAPLALGVAAYLGAAGAPPSTSRLLALGGAALVAAAFARRRGVVYAALVSGGVALAAVAWVLSRSSFAAEGRELVPLLAGLAAGVGATVAGGALGRRAPRLAGAGLLVLLLPAYRLLDGQRPTLPASDAAAVELAGLGPQAEQASHRLEELAAAGMAEAGYAWAGAALRENGDPELLRATCPRGGGVGPGVLGVRFAEAVAVGRDACAAVRGWPEEGAARLASLDHAPPALTRLRADLLMEAGALGEAAQAYEAAAARGDPYARRDAAQALLRRGRADLAPSPGDDPVLALWLSPEVESPAAWRAWNELHDFADLAPAWRRGLWPTDAPGKTHAVFDRDLSRRVLASRSRYAQGFALSLTPTPGRRAPSRLELHAKSLRAFRVTLATAEGRRVYTCEALPASPPPDTEALPPELCAGQWRRVVLEPGLVGRLESFELRGDFRLARIVAEP